MTESQHDVLVEILAVVRDQLKWQRAVAVPLVREALTGLLKTKAQQKAYDLCDGEHTFREIAKDAGASLGSISSWAKSWQEAGLAYEDQSGRVRHLASLSSLGLSLDGA